MSHRHTMPLFRFSATLHVDQNRRCDITDITNENGSTTPTTYILSATDTTKWKRNYDSSNLHLVGHGHHKMKTGLRPQQPTFSPSRIPQDENGTTTQQPLLFSLSRKRQEPSTDYTAIKQESYFRQRDKQFAMRQNQWLFEPAGNTAEVDVTWLLRWLRLELPSTDSTLHPRSRVLSSRSALGTGRLGETAATAGSCCLASSGCPTEQWLIVCGQLLIRS